MNNVMNDYRYDSRYDSRCKMDIQEAVEYILSRNYGDTIPFEKVAKILHYNIEDEKEKKKFKSTMCRIRSFLIEYGYILKSIAGIGYYILKPKQIAGHCYRTYIIKTQRLLGKSNRILTHTDKTEMSDTRIEEHGNVLQLNETLDLKIWETIQSSGYYKRKAYYDNLED